LNSIWEGSGNVNALDVLRAMQREPDSLAAYFEEVASAPRDLRLQRLVDGLKKEIVDPDGIEFRARGLVEHMAVALQASLMLRFGEPAAAELFCASRLNGESGHMFGVLPRGHDVKSMIERHRPRLDSQ